MGNEHHFIITFPQNYDTTLEEKGAILIGGQKQRMFIWRALIRNPKI